MTKQRISLPLYCITLVTLLLSFPQPALSICVDCNTCANKWTGGTEQCGRDCGQTCAHASPTMNLASTYDTGIRISWHQTGFVISAVLLHSPAADAGVRTGDEIVKVNGRTYAGSEKPMIEGSLRSPRPGSVKLVLWRRDRMLEVKLQKRPLLAILDEAWMSRPGYARPYSGERVLPFVAGSRIEVNGGIALVRSLLPNSPGEQAGLLLGDEILSLNGHSISRLGQEGVEDLLQGFRSNLIRLQVRRNETQHEVEFHLQGLTRLTNRVLVD